MMFASKTPRDLNHDPLPIVVGHPDGNRINIPEGEEFTYAGYIAYRPRPEFDHVQHNEPNPILVEFRKYADDHTDTGWLAWHWTKNEVQWAEMCLEDEVFPDEPMGTPEQEAHAYRVLTRLARMEGHFND